MIFFGSDTKSKGNKRKINKWDYIKLNCLCKAKENVKKIKMQPTGREEMFANHVSDNGFVSKIHKELI